MFYSALIGNPVDHSVSNILFEYLANSCSLEYRHLKIRISSKKNLKKSLVGLNNLGFCGINVTLPYKIDIIKYLDEVTQESKNIGAVNTIVFKNGKTIGYNTDSYGAFSAIEFKLKKIDKSDNVLIIGSGGAARAIIYSLYKKTKKIVILNHDLTEAKKLSKTISNGEILFKKLNDINIKNYLVSSNIIINATPVGMFPNEQEEIIKKTIFKEVDIKNKYFFDAIFNPYKTRLLINAEKRGAKVCSGMYMMIFQAIKAFNLWTGFNPNINIEKVNNILKKSIKNIHD